MNHLGALRREGGHRRALHLRLREIHRGVGQLRIARVHRGEAGHGRRSERLLRRLGGVRPGGGLHGGSGGGEEGAGVEIETVLLVEEKDGLVGGGDAVVDHGGVVGEVAELGVVALHPVELALVLVEADRDVVLAVVENHANEVVHHALPVGKAVALEHSQVQRHHERLHDREHAGKERRRAAGDGLWACDRWSTRSSA